MSSHLSAGNSLVRLPTVIAIGFTGHRKLHDESLCRKVIREFLERQKAAAGAIYGMSSIAAGGDLLFAESCLELGIALRVQLPMPKDQFRTDFDGPSWERAERILGAATSVEVAAQSGQRSERYYECGIVTVLQSEILVALWDGKEARGKGGTAEIVEFALAIGRPVVRFDSETGNRETFNEREITNLRNDAEMDFLNGLPDVGVSPRGESGEAVARAWFSKIDRNASRLAPRSRKLAAIPIIYTAIAALFSSFATHRQEAGTLLAISAGFGMAAALIPALLRVDSWQNRWARTRTAAEVCRSMIALWNTPGVYDVVGSEAIPDLRGMLTALHFLRMKDNGGKRMSLEAFRQAYREERLEEQITYFSANSLRAVHEARVFRTIAWVSVGMAILVAAWWFGGKSFDSRAHGSMASTLAPLALSALFQTATVVGALVVIRDCDRRQHRYRELEQWLRNWSPQFDALHTWESVLDVAKRIERALLVELLEWRSLMRHPKIPR